MTKKRIWELDAFRGLCILGMVAVHAVYDAVELYGILDWEYSNGFLLVKDGGGVLFLLLSGVSATLGSRSVRRGLIVLGCGMLVTLVTALVDMAIVFGVLHCLGVCMLLWHFFRRLPTAWLGISGAVFVLAGIVLARVTVSYSWLIPLGVTPAGFASADYFPLLPNLGFFLIGAALGRRLYREKQSLFPNVSSDRPFLRFLQACGRHSLTIYLLHQPVLMLALELLG